MKRAKVLALATIPMALAIGFSGSAGVAAAAQQPAAKPAAQPAAKPAAKPVGQANAVKPMPHQVNPLAFGTGTTIAPGDWGFDDVSCPSGTVLGGGGATNDIDIFLTDSFFDGGNGWFVGGRNTGDHDEQLAAYVTCTAP